MCPKGNLGRSILKVLMDNLEDGVREMESVQNLVLSRRNISDSNWGTLTLTGYFKCFN